MKTILGHAANFSIWIEMVQNSAQIESSMIFSRNSYPEIQASKMHLVPNFVS